MTIMIRTEVDRNSTVFNIFRNFPIRCTVILNFTRLLAFSRSLGGFNAMFCFLTYDNNNNIKTKAVTVFLQPVFNT